ncbi:MAG TPA: hypothetical protein VH575_26105 [Gemmataceae bacterium]|jgi:hypothetical protein
MADKTNGSQGKKAAGGMTKKEAVAKGLGVLGKAATPSQLQKHIKDSYGIDRTPKHIGVEKGKILKAAGEHNRSAAKPTAATPPAKQAAAQKPATGKEGISLRDIESVKDLVERVGATSLKKLIDVMAR